MARILLLDDDIAEITAVKRLVSRSAHRAELATTAADAARAIARDPPDLLVVAVACDGGRAVSLARTPRADGAPLPVIALGDAAGLPPAVRLVGLPVDPEQLGREIDRLLGAPAASAVSRAAPSKSAGSPSAASREAPSSTSPGAPSPPFQAPSAASPSRAGRSPRAIGAVAFAGADGLLSARATRRAETATLPLAAAGGPVTPAEDPRGWADELTALDAASPAADPRAPAAERPPDAEARRRAEAEEERLRAAIASARAELEVMRRRQARPASSASAPRTEAPPPASASPEPERSAPQPPLVPAPGEAGTPGPGAASGLSSPAAPAIEVSPAIARTSSSRRRAAVRDEPGVRLAPRTVRSAPPPTATSEPAPSEPATSAPAASAAPAPAPPASALAAPAPAAPEPATEALQSPAVAEPAVSPARADAAGSPRPEPGRSSIPAPRPAAAPPRPTTGPPRDAPPGETRDAETERDRRAVASRPPSVTPAPSAEPDPVAVDPRPLTVTPAPAGRGTLPPLAAPFPRRTTPAPFADGPSTPRPRTPEPLPPPVATRSVVVTPPPADPGPLPALAGAVPPRATPAPVVPPPPDELRAGTLSELPAPRLLAIAAAARIGGRLDLEGEVTRTLWFEGGRVVGATSADPAERVDALAVRLGLVTRDQHQQVADRAATLPARRAALLLLDAGFLKAPELSGLVRRRTEEVVFGIFGDAGARFRWEPAEVPADERAPVERPPLALAVEGVRRRWSAARLDAVLGGPDTLLSPAPDGPPADALALSPEERRVAALADGLRTVSELERGSPLDALAARQVLAALVLVGALEVRRLATRASAEEARAIDRARLADKLDQARRCDYFTVLGLARSSSAHEAREAAGRLEAELDPDRHAGDPVLAEGLGDLLRVVRDARAVLGDDGLRQAYLAALGD